MVFESQGSWVVKYSFGTEKKLHLIQVLAFLSQNYKCCAATDNTSHYLVSGTTQVSLAD